MKFMMWIFNDGGILINIFSSSLSRRTLLQTIWHSFRDKISPFFCFFYPSFVLQVTSFIDFSMNNSKGEVNLWVIDFYCRLFFSIVVATTLTNLLQIRVILMSFFRRIFNLRLWAFMEKWKKKTFHLMLLNTNTWN